MKREVPMNIALENGKTSFVTLQLPNGAKVEVDFHIAEGGMLCTRMKDMTSGWITDHPSFVYPDLDKRMDQQPQPDALAGCPACGDTLFHGYQNLDMTFEMKKPGLLSVTDVRTLGIEDGFLTCNGCGEEVELARFSAIQGVR